MLWQNEYDDHLTRPSLLRVVCATQIGPAALESRATLEDVRTHGSNVRPELS